MDRSSALLLAVVVVFAGSVFLVDLLVPPGVSVWLPYLVVVLLSLWFPSRWQTYATAAACTALVFLDLYISPADDTFSRRLTNRSLGVVVLWFAAVIGLAARRTTQLQEANRQLQQEIVQRERLQAQLLRVQRLESVGVLASGIAHDFNNLLTPILMAVKLLKEDRPETERQHLLATLQASAERGAETVRQLLSFAGGSDGPRAAVHLKHLLKEVKSILDHTFPKAIPIKMVLGEKLLPVLGDATQLSQVLMNLSVNARDAMPTGGTLTITAANTVLDAERVRLHVGARPGPYVIVGVADTGSGIPADVLDKVFDPFFTTKEHGKGSGLGLATALGIVKSHGGFIDVESAVGAGTRFVVYLPVQTTLKEEEVLAERTKVPGGHGELILVVDDEAFILDTARVTLEARGYRVVTAADGREAVAVYQQHREAIQAVILDLMMPGLDGAATLEALQALDPQVNIIASSGLRPRGWLADALAAGKKAFLQKPYTDEQILAALADVLRK